MTRAMRRAADRANVRGQQPLIPCRYFCAVIDLRLDSMQPSIVQVHQATIAEGGCGLSFGFYRADQ
ncbi:hypothetical protein J1614_004503 [Plenodomus biglobosus]|nr:hypothetical protein J1614_004503 [Plenodomus biglobosus]